MIALGKPVNEALKPFISDAGTLVSKLEPIAMTLGTKIGGALSAAKSFLDSLANGTPAVDALASAFGGLFDSLKQAASIPVNALLAALPDLGNGLLRVAGVTADFLAARLKAVGGEFGADLFGLLSNATQTLAKSLPMSSINPQSALLMNASAGMKNAQNAAMGMAAQGEAETEKVLSVDAPAAFRAAAVDGGQAVRTALQTAAAGIASMAREVTRPASTPLSSYTRGQYLATMPDLFGMGQRIGNAAGGPGASSNQTALQDKQEQRALMQQQATKLDAIRGELQRLNAL